MVPRDRGRLGMTPTAGPPSAEPVSHNPFFGLQVLTVIVLYWAPTIYALARGKQGAARVALTNLWAFFGIPWLLAWVLALTAPKTPPAVLDDYQPPPPPAPTPPPGPPPGFEEHTILLPKDNGGTP